MGRREHFSLCQRDLNDALTSGSEVLGRGAGGGALACGLPPRPSILQPFGPMALWSISLCIVKLLLVWPGICGYGMGRASEKKGK